MRWKNMEECECDRCGCKEMIQADSENQSYWHDMKRYTGEGGEKPFLLCGRCFEDYKDFMANADKEFAMWMEAKRA